MKDIIIIVSYSLLLLYYNRKIISTPVVGFQFWMLFLVINDIVNFNPTIKTSLNIMLQDIVFFYFLYVSVLRYRILGKFEKYDSTLRWFLAVLIFIIFSIPIFAILTSSPIIRLINASRGFLLLPPAFLYFFSFNYTKIDTEEIFKNLGYIAALAALIMFSRQIFSQDRVVPASGALFFSYAAIMRYSKFLEKGKVYDLFICLFIFLLVVFLRHRSVWIATGLSLLFMHIYIRSLTKLLAVIVVSVLSIIFLSAIFPSKADKFIQQISESASPFKSKDEFENSTGGGRISRWVAQINSKFEWQVLLWGLGPGYERNVYLETASGEKRLSTVSFHNHYLEQTFRIGGISVLILLIFVIRFFRLNHREQLIRKSYLKIGICASVFGTLGFGMMYSFNFLIFIFLGIGYSILTKSDENSCDYTNVQQATRIKKLALDAWKYDKERDMEA